MPRATRRISSTASTIVLSPKNALHLNFQFTRSWFQKPNSYDQQYHDFSGVIRTNPMTGQPLGPTDQRSKILTFDIAPSWTHTINPNAVLNVTGYVRRDAYNYYPSDDPFNDLGPANLQRESVAQQRSLLNAGARRERQLHEGHSQHQGRHHV